MAITNIIKNNPGKTLRFDFDSYDFSQGAEPNINLQIINKSQITYFNLVNMSGQISNYTIPNNTSDITMVLLRIMSNNTATSQASSVSITKPILHFGDTKISYAPYFTPIELCGIGDYKDAIKKSSGKNLFDKSTLQQGGLDLGGTGVETVNSARIRTNFISVQPNTTYTISNADTIINKCGIGLYKSDESYDTEHKINNGGWVDMPYSFTTQNDTKYVRIAFRNNDSTDITPNLDYKIQIEKGSSATTYESHN